MAVRRLARIRVDDAVVTIPALAAAAAETAQRAEETEATRVDFFTLKRGETTDAG